MQKKLVDNNDLTIRCVDKNDEFIRLISQVEAERLFRNNLAQLILIEPWMVKFNFVKEKWSEKNLVDLKKFKNRMRLRIHQSRISQSRITNLYGNYHVQSMDGQEMFLCNSSKCLWYLNRNLADVISENTIKLKFVANGPGHYGDAYYLNDKKNVCVVCGLSHNLLNKQKEGLTRHHVLPFMYRKHYPEQMKSHNYYDILLMCCECHEKYELEADKLKNEINKEFGINVLEQICDKGRLKASKYANTLILHEEKIPHERKLVLYQFIKGYLNKEEITKTCLEDLRKPYREACSFESKYNSEEILEKIGDLQLFTERWRQHFLDIMQPKFLPKYWDVKKPIYRGYL